MIPDVKVDLCFKAVGTRIPVDHGFALYGTLSRVLPFIHGENDLGLKLIRGRYIGDGMLDISPHSELVLRILADCIGSFLALAGKTLDVLGCRLVVGIPATRALVPSPVLHSHLVSTKNGHDQARFEAEMQNQMGQMGAHGRVSVGQRRTFSVHGKQVVGYSLLVSELTAEESILVQERGLGGRRKMGCGFFEATEDR
jgi:CRISPR-associated protein Cas6